MGSSVETITFEISDSNSYGVTVSTTVTIDLYACDRSPLVSPGLVCRFYMNLGTGQCAYPENTEMDSFCNSPLDFAIEDAPGSSTFQSVSAGTVNWADQSGDTTSQTLLFDFSGFPDNDMINLIGVYSAERLQSAVTETFQVVLCYFYEPGDIYDSPSDDVIDYNRSQSGGATQVFNIELSLYNMSTEFSLC